MRLPLLLCCALTLAPQPARMIRVRAGARVPQWGCGIGPSPHQSWRYDITSLTFTLNDPWSPPGSRSLCLAAESLDDGSFLTVEECAAPNGGGVYQRQQWQLDVGNATLGEYVRVTPRFGPGLVLATSNFDIRLFNAHFAGDSRWWLTQFNSTPPISCTPQEKLTHPGSCICACSPTEFRANQCGALPDGAIVNKNTGWCADAGPWDRFPCDPSQPMAQKNITSLPFCNASLPHGERVQDLVRRIPDSDLFSLLQTGGVPVISLRIPPWNWWNEALHGVQAKSPPITSTTVFPAPLTTAASFNKTLFHMVGSAEALEARAVYNLGGNQLTDWSPNINLVRDGRWGRMAETPGECPRLSAAYAIDYVRGMQGYPQYRYAAGGANSSAEDAPKFLHVSSCLKHYFAYDGPEDTGNTTRFNFDARVSARDLEDSYLPAFEAGSRPDLGAASGLMCSYNSINDVPACAHRDMLTNKLRETWKFDGYVTSDCGAVHCIGPSCPAGQQHCSEMAQKGSTAYYACMNVSGHNYSTSADTIIADVFKAGMDINCGNYVPPHLMHALADGAVTRSDMDVALTHLFSVLLRLGLFDSQSSQPLAHAAAADVGSARHRQIALEAAVQGVVLLTNHNATLPLAGATQTQRLAVVGRTECKLGPYAANPRAEDAATNCDLVNAFNGTGYQSVTRVLNLSMACASTADVIIAVLDTDCKGESADRHSIGPTPADARSLAHIAAQRQRGLCAADKPFVLVVLGACVTDLAVAASAFDAVLWGGAGGERGGEALVRVLYGLDVPSGRLPVTMYSRAIDSTSIFDMRMRPAENERYPGRTYRFHTGAQVFPAFHGLSYTTFSYQLSVQPELISVNTIDTHLSNRSLHRFSCPQLASVALTVANSGKRAAATSVLVFVAGPHAGSNGEPIRELVAFDKIWLEAGASSKVEVPLGAWELSSTDAAGRRRATTGHWTLSTDGAQYVINVV